MAFADISTSNIHEFAAVSTAEMDYIKPQIGKPNAIWRQFGLPDPTSEEICYPKTQEEREWWVKLRMAQRNARKRRLMIAVQAVSEQEWTRRSTLSIRVATRQSNVRKPCVN